ncbi:MAG: hypothetical protein HYS17_06815 [Micavibrio aeruginosavorus]|uniref:Uncharacterized protein n=1 Tax=Micavibrio aeruginosavorus TaxID=349221 RepID=A0A7T5R0H7_9BACT|nr:MAG: hypothetical protein HYS17_06815 [Micavibrio aeruginosavorus]
MTKFIHGYMKDNEGRVGVVIGSYDESRLSYTDVRMNDCEFSFLNASYLDNKKEQGKGWLTKKMPPQKDRDEYWLYQRARNEVLAITSDPVRYDQLPTDVEAAENVRLLKAKNDIVCRRDESRPHSLARAAPSMRPD